MQIVLHILAVVDQPPSSATEHHKGERRRRVHCAAPLFGAYSPETGAIIAHWRSGSRFPPVSLCPSLSFCASALTVRARSGHIAHIRLLIAASCLGRVGTGLYQAYYGQPALKATTSVTHASGHRTTSSSTNRIAYHRRLSTRSLHATRPRRRERLQGDRERADAVIESGEDWEEHGRVWF
jgi:hypothetical protein